MFRLYQRFPQNVTTVGLHPISVIVRRHIQDVGLEVVRKEEGERDNSKYVEKLIELHDHYMALITSAFQSHSIFTKVLKEAFEGFVNKDVGTTSTAELLANYCDNLLKKSADHVDAEFDGLCERIVTLFSYLSDKVPPPLSLPHPPPPLQDMFAEFYRKQLARRLLTGVLSDDNERTFITRLKHRCGSQFTSKLEGMVNDMAVSRDTNAQFAEFITKHGERLMFEPSVTVRGGGGLVGLKRVRGMGG
jgi:cullin 1